MRWLFYWTGTCLGKPNTALIICAFLTCLGMTFLILACAVPTPKIFYPFFVLLFYALSVLPVFIAKRTTPVNETNPKTEFALFLTAGMVLSAFALPIVLAHSAVITWTACTLTLISNIINYVTIFGYTMRDEQPYGSMF
ncbi:leptin receptor gene-related protein [Drosophila guanche]|uniref:Blast:Leptin receptor gene-related protein n=1 Tax=Drosophila guanche TaxID=7266 RepID=A0A3B0J0L1_DROGU|nr:leptin receptor gene-related protein [Drosophila guanche]SPP74504.1 blast:Leptin receptor gene-related protein [Drosophila guanche]